MNSDKRKEVLWHKILSLSQCLRSEWIPGSTDSDPRGKVSTKNCKKNVLKTQICAIDKRFIVKISWFLNGSSSFSMEISEKIKTKNLKILLCKISSKIFYSYIKIKWILITLSYILISILYRAQSLYFFNIISDTQVFH